jgi:hypothetical protein
VRAVACRRADACGCNVGSCVSAANAPARRALDGRACNAAAEQSAANRRPRAAADACANQLRNLMLIFVVIVVRLTKLMFNICLLSTPSMQRAGPNSRSICSTGTRKELHPGQA